MAGMRDWLSGARGKPEEFHPANPATAVSAAGVSTDELIALRLQARRLRLARRRPTAGALAGTRGSRFRGRGMDYQESRAYQPGDDVRTMDWRVTARAGHPYVKLYREERERPVVALLDLNPGMFFGTRGTFKSAVAARIAVLIGWAATLNGDRIGALVFNGGHRELQPRGGRRGALRLVRALVQVADPARGMARAPGSGAAVPSAPHGDLNEALRRLRRVTRPGSLLFVISDFYAIDSETRKQLQRLRRHNDVVAVQVVDPLELDAPPPGRYGITDGTERGIIDTAADRGRAAYTAWCDRHHAAVRNLMRSVAVPLLRVSTTDDAASALAAFLAQLDPAPAVRAAGRGEAA